MGRACAQGKDDGRSRHDEDQGHAPAIHEAHALTQPANVLRAGKRGVQARPSYAGMIKDQQAERAYTKPVEIGAAGRGRNGKHGQAPWNGCCEHSFLSFLTNTLKRPRRDWRKRGGMRSKRSTLTGKVSPPG